MANAIIRPFPMYVDSKKVAEITDGTYDIMSGDEAQIGTEGYMGHSDGATTTKIEATCIVPVAGVSVTLLDKVINKKYVTVGLLADNKLQQMQMRITAASYTWNSKSGTANGRFTFEGGPPSLT